MKDYLKFLERLPKPLRLKIIKVVEQIAAGKLQNLNIKPLQGQKDFFRCRVGKIRVIFFKSDQGNVIFNIGFRGDVYK